MKLQIRQGVFETNSSSTHSLTMMMKSDYEVWKSGEKYLYINNYSFSKIKGEPVAGKLYTEAEIIEFIKKENAADLENLDTDFDDLRKDYGFKAVGEESDYLESFYDEFTTPSGETVVAFGEYGYDG